MGRDTKLDMLRGFMMLYIIFIIHGLYWFQVVSSNSIIFSLLLFEMPVMFYISGAAQKLSSTKTFKQHIRSRCIRVIVPYMVWCTGTICVLIVYGDIQSDWIHLITGCSLISIPYVWHIWFIYPYLIVSILGYFLLKAYKKGKLFVFSYFAIMAAILVLMDYTDMLHQSHFIRPILVYSVFYVFGFTYKEAKSTKHLILLVLTIIIYLFLIISPAYPYATQENKFPPNFAFLCFGMIAILSLPLILSLVERCSTFFLHTYVGTCAHRLFKFANDYGYELYLYQSFAMQGYAFLAKKFWPDAFVGIKYLLLISMLPFLLIPMVYVARIVNNFISMKLEDILKQ